MPAGCAILAAGSSTRAGTDKVGADLGGQPVLAWSLAAALASGSFSRIVVVTRADRVAAVEAIVRPRAPDARVIERRRGSAARGHRASRR
ncbi:MAG: hypothetical protein E6I28_09410 [Chloroflexi bacterium]|nr:MAG: hypothetical protein E6I28_09410 [Chloroflexota bacterium]